VECTIFNIVWKSIALINYFKKYSSIFSNQK
jgi:hypothetical protein